MEMQTLSLQTRLSVSLAAVLAGVLGLALGVCLYSVPANTPTIFISLLLASLVLYGFFLLLARKFCVTPLRHAVEVAKGFAAGNLSVPDAGPGSGEFADLQGALTAIALTVKHDRGLLQGILHGLPMPYLLVDRDERTVKINQPCLDMLEIEGALETCHGKTLAEIFYNDPTRKTAVGQSIREGKIFRNLEVTIKGHKGGERHVLANVFPLYNLDNACIGGLCLYIDMTALKQAEASIKDNHGKILEAASKLEGIVGIVTTASEALSAQIGLSSHGAEEQSRRVAETAASMEEMNATVFEVAKNASYASQTADQARTKAEEGANVVSLVVKGIEGVRRQSQEMKTDMGTLGKQAEGIGQIMNVISDIADQTNLLALNAAIEAARAGEAGRGFAVVADEVRKLAEKTMTATKEVGEAIRGIQDGTRKNSENVERSGKTIEEVTALASTSGASLREIVLLVESTTDQVRSIATASEEQSSASEEINQSIDDINRISSETSDAMRQSAQAVAELTNQTQMLKSLILEMQA
jgi:methyl-accepting chemotaxis protein